MINKEQKNLLNPQSLTDLIIGNKKKNDNSGSAIASPEDNNSSSASTQNLHPAIRQLRALGYKVGDRVTGRNISIIGGKNKDWQGRLTENNIIIQEGTWSWRGFNYDGKIHEDGLSWLDEQNETRGIYFNVNAGRDNSSVIRFYAGFFESDKGTHREQQLVIDSFGLAATVQVRTKRSNHTYYVIEATEEEYKNLETWAQLQEKIAYVMGSDPAVKDKPRLMRLAGFYHVSLASYAYDGNEFDYIECQLLKCDGSRKYTIQQIDETLDEYCIQQGIKPYSQQRFSLYQYIISKLNQKKNGVNYSHPKFDPNIARTCEDSELEEISIRAKNWARLCERKHKNLECADPESAWTDSLEKVKATYQSDFNFPTIDLPADQLREAGLLPGETLPYYFARTVGYGFSAPGEPGGRRHYATCQCANHGSSTGSTDNLHINVSDPNYPPGMISCKSGCDPKDVMLAFRQRAQDAGDPLWNASWGNRTSAKKTYQQDRDKYLLEREAKRKEIAKFTFTREPNILVTDGFFPDIPLNELPKGLVGIKGDWGTGKSHLMKNLIKQFVYNKVLQIGHLNSLLYNTAPKFGLTHHQDAKDQKWGLMGCDRLAITDISVAHLHKIEVYEGQHFILVIDEIEQVLKNLLTTKNLKGMARLIYFRKLIWLIRNADYVIFADADLSDPTLEFLEAIRNAEKVGQEPERTFIIQHTKKQGAGRGKIKISTDKGATLKRLRESLEGGNKTIASFETKSDLQTFEVSIGNCELKKSTDIIHGDNSQDEHVREYIKNIDSLYTESNNLLHTGTLGTGIDLSKPHYEKRFGIYTGNVYSATEQCQLFSRYRPDCDSEIYCDSREYVYKIDAEQLTLELLNKNNESIDYFSENVSQLIEAGLYPRPDGTLDEYDQAFAKYWGIVNARHNASRANPRQTLIDRLTDAGYELEFLDDTLEQEENDLIHKAHKTTKKQLREQEDLANALARTLSDEEYREAVQQKGTLDKEKQREVFKTRLEKTLGITVNSEWVRLERTKKISKGLSLLHILLTDDETAIAYEMRDRKNNPMITDRSHFLKKRELLKKLHIDKFLSYLNAEKSYNQHSEWAKFIAKTARNNHKAMETWLGIKINFQKDKDGTFNQSNSEIVGLILSKLGIITTSEQVTINGKREREYQRDEYYWNLAFQTILPHMDGRKPNQDDYLSYSYKFDPEHPERYCVPRFDYDKQKMAEALAT